MIRILIWIFLWTGFAAVEALPTIAIITGKIQGGKPWDPDSIHSGITGSEEAVIYISQKLAQLGHRVVVLAEVPPNSPHSAKWANPRFVDFSFDDGSFFDVAISWRLPEIAALLKTRARKVYFWPHDFCSGRFSESEIKGFDDVLWLSQSQRAQWISVNPAFSQFTQIFGNAINPEQFRAIEERSNPYSCIYASSYERGLEVLLDVWPIVKKLYPRATLDIYYGWPKVGFQFLLPIQEGKLRSSIASLGFLAVHEHGLVSHEELTRAYERASFWTYPCTTLAIETFCISALRAQFAGAIPVIIKGTALYETVPHGYFCLDKKEYLTTLLQAMADAEKISLEDRKKQRKFILEKYTWEKIAAEWSAKFSH